MSETIPEGMELRSFLHIQGGNLTIRVGSRHPTYRDKSFIPFDQAPRELKKMADNDAYHVVMNRNSKHPYKLHKVTKVDKLVPKSLPAGDLDKIPFIKTRQDLVDPRLVGVVANAGAPTGDASAAEATAEALRKIGEKEERERAEMAEKKTAKVEEEEALPEPVKPKKKTTKKKTTKKAKKASE